LSLNHALPRRWRSPPAPHGWRWRMPMRIFESDRFMNVLSLRVLAALLIGVTFACGFLTGRVTSQPPTGSNQGTPRGSENEGGVTSVSQRVMKRYAEDLKLSDDQLRILGPLFESTGERMQLMPKNSDERLRELERFHLEMEPHLNEGQKSTAREILARARRLRRGA
jgi:hypothetical protein